MLKRSGLLWIDCSGGLVAGALVLVAHRWLAEWHQLPLAWIVFMGVANLVYGCFSLTLAMLRECSLGMVMALAIANMLWGPVCCGMVWANWETISWIGIVHLLGEGAYVSGLGAVEWSYRRQLSATVPPALAHVQTEE